MRLPVYASRTHLVALLAQRLVAVLNAFHMLFITQDIVSRCLRVRAVILLESVQVFHPCNVILHDGLDRRREALALRGGKVQQQGTDLLDKVVLEVRRMNLFVIQQLRQLLILSAKSLNLGMSFISQQTSCDRAIAYLTSCWLATSDILCRRSTDFRSSLLCSKASVTRTPSVSEIWAMAVSTCTKKTS